MNRTDAERIVFSPYTAPRLSVGFYTPTPEFQAFREHIAVMNDETTGLHAITGPVGGDDENTFASFCEAVVFSGAFEMLEFVKKAAAGELQWDTTQDLANEILESLRHKMDGLDPAGVSAVALQKSILCKLGLGPRPEVKA